MERQIEILGSKRQRARRRKKPNPYSRDNGDRLSSGKARRKKLFAELQQERRRLLTLLLNWLGART